MFACFALLLEDHAHNLIRKLVYDVLRKGKYGIESALLPQHISLKQSFYISDIQEIEDYFDHFISEISPFDITFGKVDLINVGSEGNESQILWVDIEESSQLRTIHHKLNEELSVKYFIPMSGFDGPEYHFHSTMTYGYNQKLELETVMNEINSNFVRVKNTVRKAVLLYSLDDQVQAGRFMTYKILDIN